MKIFVFQKDYHYINGNTEIKYFNCKLKQLFYVIVEMLMCAKVQYFPNGSTMRILDDDWTGENLEVDTLFSISYELGEYFNLKVNPIVGECYGGEHLKFDDIEHIAKDIKVKIQDILYAEKVEDFSVALWEIPTEYWNFKYFKTQQEYEAFKGKEQKRMTRKNPRSIRFS